MKRIAEIVFIIAFVTIIVLPLAFFNHEENAVSEIDNKVLTENPLRSTQSVEDLTDSIEQYVSERIGFRDDMIIGYTVGNDVLFGEMVHPTYMYGKDGYIFFKASAPRIYGEYDDAFVNMVREIQKYCDSRGMPFVFVFEPSKLSVYKDKLPDGYNYNNDWVGILLSKLDASGVNYADNLEEMTECYEEDIPVFNVKYNAGHWNDTGAFYGMNNALKKLKQYDNKVHVNDLSEFIIEQELNTTLPVSEFPIHEYEPKYSIRNSEEIIDNTRLYRDELMLNEDYQYFAYYINRQRLKEGSPKALVFQGSYINGMGYKFLQNSFGEYIAVHDYQNILNFEYYVNIFQPDCIVFEAAEYTFLNKYFDFNGMKNFKLNPRLSEFDGFKSNAIDAIITIDKRDSLSNIMVDTDLDGVDYAYMIMDGKEYDLMQAVSDDSTSIDYSATVKSSIINTHDMHFIFVSTINNKKYVCDY